LEGVANSVMVSHMLNSIQASQLKAFVAHSQHPDSFLGMNSLAVPGYESGSGQIFGILKQMKEEFEANLSEAQKLEAKNVEDYNALKAAKDEEMAATKKLIDESEQDLAAFMEKHAQAMEELEDTEDQLKLDEEFLFNLKKKCAEGDKEYEERVKSRMEEINAVADTIAYLNSDEAHQMFDKTVNTDKNEAGMMDFVQVSVERQAEKRLRQRAVAVLDKVAGFGGTESSKIALIQAAVQLDAFTKVIEMIDKLIVELKDQQADEVKEHDYCHEELNKNTLEMDKQYDKQEQLQAQIADLTETIKKLTEEVERMKGENTEMQTQMKRASENREAENADYQQSVTDQRVTQQILQKALERMQQVYLFLQQPGAPHIQTSATDTDPGNGPARFKNNAQKKAGGSKVVTMIQTIISDSKALEGEAIRAEQDSQTAYENFMKDSNASIQRNLESIANMTEEKAKSEQSLNLAQTDLEGTNKQLENLHTLGADLHDSCDYLIKNFSIRQESRAKEIDALGEAKAILSGMQSN